MHVPFEHSGVASVQKLPHEPQLALSFFVSAQYGGPASGKQSVCDDRQLEAHMPPAQTCSVPHVMPHVPQFELSVCVVAQ